MEFLQGNNGFLLLCFVLVYRTCMHVMYVCICLSYICASKYVYALLCTCVCNVCMLLLVHICGYLMYVYVCMQSFYVYTCNVCMFMYVCLYMHTYVCFIIGYVYSHLLYVHAMHVMFTHHVCEYVYLSYVWARICCGRS